MGQGPAGPTRGQPPGATRSPYAGPALPGATRARARAAYGLLGARIGPLVAGATRSRSRAGPLVAGAGAGATRSRAYQGSHQEQEQGLPGATRSHQEPPEGSHQGKGSHQEQGLPGIKYGPIGIWHI